MSWFTKTALTYSSPSDDGGTDGSDTYGKNKKLRFMILQHNTGATVSFKPFLSNYRMNFSSKLMDETKDYFKLFQKKLFTNESLGIELSLTLDLLAHSIEEAQLNLKRINELDKMYKSMIIEPNKTNALVRNSYSVFISNLFCAQHGGGYPTSRSELKTKGVPCFIDAFSFSIDKDMGMFESGSDLLPKKMILEISFKVSNAAYWELSGGKYLWLPIQADGVYLQGQTSTFPFGMNNTLNSLGTGDLGSDGSKDYSNNKKALIYIASSVQTGGSFLTFKPFLDSFSWKYSRENFKIEEIPFMGGALQTVGGNDQVRIENQIKFSVLSHSTNEARQNMAKLQALIRMCDQFYPQKNATSPFGGFRYVWPQTTKAMAPMLWFKFNDINSAERKYSINSVESLREASKLYVIKGFSIDFDLSMGMFEYSGKFSFKKFDISFDFLQVGANDAPYVTYVGKSRDGQPVNSDLPSHDAITHKIFK